MTRTRPHIATIEAAERALYAWRLYNQNRSFRDIARILDVSVSTAWGYVQQVEETTKLKGQLTTSEEGRRAQDLILRYAIGETLDGLARSKEDALEIITKETEGGGTETTTKRKPQSGNPAWVAALARLLDRQAKLMGLDPMPGELPDSDEEDARTGYLTVTSRKDAEPFIDGAIPCEIQEEDEESQGSVSETDGSL